jgi:putative FmdB family regulatory protein
MPIYEFVCTECGEKIDKIVSVGTTKIKCDKCDGEAYKVMSAPSFHLKGTCWAKDSYGLKKDKKAKEV